MISRYFHSLFIEGVRVLVYFEVMADGHTVRWHFEFVYNDILKGRGIKCECFDADYDKAYKNAYRIITTGVFYSSEAI